MSNPLKLSFSAQIFLALCVGVFTGLFFGEQVAWLQSVGTIFIKLLQVAVIPYIILSLVLGLGSLSYQQAKEIAKKFTIMLFCFWAFSLLTIFLMALAFPVWESSEFFSAAQIIPPPAINYYDLYIPSNPFKSLSDSMVPAIVVFSLLSGGALIGVENKQVLLEPISILIEALNKITKIIVRYLPIGIFAISAASAGTIQPEDFEKLEVYFIVYIGTALILSFWVIPFFISAVTPFKYADIIHECRDVLMTAFASGNLFILIPVITEACNSIFEKHQLRTAETDKYNEIIVPIFFNFPALGRLLVLNFILFAAWFTNTDLAIAQQALLAFNGIFSLFASVHISIPFLLAYLHLPSDLYQLFLSGDVLTARFSTLASAIYLIGFTLSTSAYLSGLVEFKIKKILLYVLSCVVVIGAVIVASQTLFSVLLDKNKDLSATLKYMQVDWDAPKRISYSLVASNKSDNATPESIVKRGKLRIGYEPGRVPFTFNNVKHDLVGFDIEMMNHLSTSMGVKLEFIPFSSATNLYQSLDDYQIDIVISGVRISNEYLAKVLYTQPTMNLTTALIVKDYRKKEFSDYSDVAANTDLELAMTGHYPRVNYIQQNFPNINITKLRTAKAFFEGKQHNYDGFITSIEEGMTLVMLYPEYSVSYDASRINRFPVGYAVNKNNLKLQAMLNSWLDIQKSTGRIEELYDYWIQGKGAVTKEPRWSILNNVLNAE